MRSNHAAFVRRLVAIVASLALGFAAVGRFGAVTPKGVQCPTAAAVTVAVRNCCGHVVGYEVRKPKEGERGFLQCRCAEKKSASQQATVSGPKFEITAPVPFEYTVPAPPPARWTAFAYAATASDWRPAPPTRPPLLS